MGHSMWGEGRMQEANFELGFLHFLLATTTPARGICTYPALPGGPLQMALDAEAAWWPKICDHSPIDI